MTASVLWINGPFGVGKTQAAYELHSRLANSFVFDPEIVGFALRSLSPRALWGQDFQDLPLWRTTVANQLLDVARRANGIVIVPMTLVNTEYFDEIVGHLRRSAITVHHFALIASREAVLGRLRRREVMRGRGRDSWAAQRVDRCLTVLRTPPFAEQIETDHLTIEDAAELIANRLALTLTPRRGWLVGRAYRAWIGLRHVRWGL